MAANAGGIRVSFMLIALAATTLHAQVAATAATGDLQVAGYALGTNYLDYHDHRLALVNTATGDMTVLPTDRKSEEPVFSPDGSRIAYGVYDFKDNESIWICDTDGSNAHKLVDCDWTDNYILNWTANNNIWWSQGGNSKDQNMYVVDVATGIKTVYWSYEPQASATAADGIYKLCVSRDETVAASMVHGGGWGFIYDLPGKQKIQAQQGGCNGALSGLGAYYMTGLTQGGFMPDGVTSLYGAGRLWDAQTGETVAYCVAPGVVPYQGNPDEYQIREWRFSHHSDAYASCRGFGGNGGQTYLYEVLTNSYYTFPTHFRGSDFWPGALPDIGGDPVPAIALNTSALTFAGDDASHVQTVTVTNVVGGTTLGPVTIALAGSPSWLTATRGGTGNSQTVTVSVDPSGLAAGVCATTVSVSGGGADVPATFTVTFDVGSAVAAPSDLNATAPAPRTVDLSWTDNSDSETGFTVERRTQGDTWATVASLGADVTAYTDADIGPNTYEYRVKAVAGGLESGYCTPASVSVLGNKTISVISPNASTPVQPGTTVTIVWEATDVGNVLVYYSADFGESWVLLNPGDDIATDDPRWANLEWHVPSDNGVTTYLIGVKDYADQSVFSTSQSIPVAASAVTSHPASFAGRTGLQSITTNGSGVDIAFRAVAGARTTIALYSLSGEELFRREHAAGGAGPVSWTVPHSRVSPGQYVVSYHSGGVEQRRSVAVR